MESTNILKWIQDWYLSKCNGDWEHSYGVKIDTVDNPGWYITIDLNETELESFEYDSGLVETDTSDWHFYHFKDSKYEASGDPNKLDFLLTKFKELVEQQKK